jgi:phage protein D
MSITNTFLVDVDGTALADDVKALLTSAYVDDSQRLPDMFELRFRDPAKTVLSDTGAQVGSTVRVSVMTSTSQTPVLLMEGEVTALEAEFDTGGTFIVMRGYDPAHRLFRGRGTYSYTQMTASDIAQKVAQRAGLRTGTIASTSTVFDHVSQAGTSDWDLLDGLARDAGYEISVREDGFTFAPPTKSGDAPEGHGADQAETEPLVLHLGSDLLRFRAVVTSAGQVKEIEVRGWDVGTKAALKATAPAKTESATLSTSPQDLAHTFGDPVYVSTDVPHRTQAEVDTAAAALAEEIAGTFAEFDGVAIGNPDVRAGVAVTLDNLGDVFDGKYTVTRSRHRFDPTTGYTTAFSVTGAHDRSMLSLAGGATRPPAAPRGVVIGQVNDVNDPEEQGRVTLMFPWLSDDYVSSWARTVHAGAGKDRGAMVLP